MTNTTPAKTVLVSKETPRVSRSALLEPGNYITIPFNETEDGLVRVVVSEKATDEEFLTAVEALKEHDEVIESKRKMRLFIDSFEDDDEVIERCYAAQGQGNTITRQYQPRGRSGWATAYVDKASGEGLDAHSGVPVVVKFDEDLEDYIQVDPWSWTYNKTEGKFEKVV